MKLNLFDSLVVPILLYGSEVWGIYQYKEIENIHIKCCKIMLGMIKQTYNCGEHGELGRYQLSILALEISFKYWLKIKKTVT